MPSCSMGFCVAGASWSNSVPVMSEGIRSGVDWIRLNTSDMSAPASYQERLGQTGHAHQQAVPARKHGDHHLVDHLVHADDDLADLGDDAIALSAVRLDGGGPSTALPSV